LRPGQLGHEGADVSLTLFNSSREAFDGGQARRPRQLTVLWEYRGGLLQTGESRSPGP
jgi:hypothetical protein